MIKRNQEIVRRYKLGETLRSIGEKFDISKQRVWQIISVCGCGSISNKRRIMANPLDSEKHIASILRKKGFKVEYMPYNHIFDLLARSRVRIEVKYRLTAGGDRYYHFPYLNNKNFDVFIAICGDYKNHKADYYIFPGSVVKHHISIPKNPIFKTRRQRLYKNKWGIIQKISAEIKAENIGTCK